MPRLSNMVGETGLIEIPVSNDEPLIVHYRRGVMTPRRQMRILRATSRAGQAVDGDQVDPEILLALVELLSELLVSWNLTTDAGLPIPTDVESLQDVDLSILTSIITEIGRQGRVDPLSGDGSRPGSSAEARAGLELLPTTTG